MQKKVIAFVFIVIIIVVVYENILIVTVTIISVNIFHGYYYFLSQLSLYSIFTWSSEERDSNTQVG